MNKKEILKQIEELEIRQQELRQLLLSNNSMTDHLVLEDKYRQAAKKSDLDAYIELSDNALLVRVDGYAAYTKEIDPQSNKELEKIIDHEIKAIPLMKILYEYDQFDTMRYIANDEFTLRSFFDYNDVTRIKVNDDSTLRVEYSISRNSETVVLRDILPKSNVTIDAYVSSVDDEDECKVTLKALFDNVSANELISTLKTAHKAISQTITLHKETLL